MAAWPTLKEVRTFLRLQPDPDQDGIIQTALAAATDYGIGRMGFTITYDPDTGAATYTPRYAADATDLPDSAHQAALMHSARLYRRRDTVDGTIGFGDMGAIRVGRVDPDIEALYARKAPLVFG